MLVRELRHAEAVYVDADRLEEICHQLGYSGGESAICAAMEDLAELLHQAGVLWKSDDVMALEVTARQITGVASRIGMVGLAQVAEDVMGLAMTQDRIALAATVARLRRMGEQSLLEIWDRQDLTL